MSDFRALCSELVGKIDYTWGAAQPDDVQELLDRARAALAEEAGVGATDEQLLALRSWSSYAPTFDSDLVGFARAVLARYGTHPRPIPVAERPWEREGFCDAKGRCWWLNPTVTVLPPVWWLVSVPQSCTCGVMLPAAAIPLPEVGP